MIRRALVRVVRVTKHYTVCVCVQMKADQNQNEVQCVVTLTTLTTWPPPWLSSARTSTLSACSLPATPPELTEPVSLSPTAIGPRWPHDFRIITQAEAAAIYPPGSDAPVVPLDYPPVRARGDVAGDSACVYWPRHRCRWRSVHGIVLCGICVPPAPGVVAEWLDDAT